MMMIIDFFCLKCCFGKQFYVILLEVFCNYVYIVFELFFILLFNYICLKNNFFLKIKQFRLCLILNIVNFFQYEYEYSDVLDILVV